MNKRPGQSVLEDVYLYNLETGCLGLFIFAVVYKKSVRKMCIKCEQIY